MKKQPMYLSCAETAKRLRAALKAAFPAMRFSVRSKTYAGGASIAVEWMDGPTAKQVQAVCNRFEGATFDGMTDCKGYQTHVVDGQSIHYGADFIHARRAFSVAFLTSVAQAYCRKYRCPMPPILEQSSGAYIPRRCTEEEAMMRLAWETSAGKEEVKP